MHYFKTRINFLIYDYSPRYTESVERLVHVAGVPSSIRALGAG